jgi:uncharacterized membrane protein
MGDTRRDPVDHHGSTAPGLIVVAVGLVALVVSIASFAFGRAGVGVDAVVVSLLSAGVGLGWLTTEGRRVRQIERDTCTRERAHA